MLQVEYNADWAIIRLHGVLDATVAEEVRAAIVDLVLDRKTTVILDVADVHSLDSEAIAVLANGARRLEAARGKLAVTGPRDEVGRVMSGADIDGLFPIYDSWLDVPGLPSRQDWYVAAGEPA